MSRFRWVIGSAGSLFLVGWLLHQGLLWPKTPYRNEASQKLLATSLLNLEGKSTTLDAWQGQVRVVNFWATWCPPCQDEIPDFVRFQNIFGGKSLQVVGIALDDQAAVEAFSRKHQINYPVLLGSGREQALTAEFGNAAQGVPFTFVLTGDGKIAATRVGRIDYASLEQWVRPLLGR